MSTSTTPRDPLSDAMRNVQGASPKINLGCPSSRPPDVCGSTGVAVFDTSVQGDTDAIMALEDDTPSC
ncbi:hypothetical protein SESBI_00839 [Sesbania bispinosa]|nr:hypothetical protein SESBI_00839 [Sesbania bispinosa]